MGWDTNNQGNITWTTTDSFSENYGNNGDILISASDKTIVSYYCFKF